MGKVEKEQQERSEGRRRRLKARHFATSAAFIDVSLQNLRLYEIYERPFLAATRVKLPPGGRRETSPSGHDGEKLREEARF